MKNLIRAIGLVVMVIVAMAASPGIVDAAEAASPPNFVFFLVDDLGWSDLGCYGNTFHETPNVDALARQGMRFTNAYAACPVCSPTRASIMTGKYPATLDLTDFIPGHPYIWAKLTVPKFNQQLPLAEITFAEALKQAGYTTGSFGKWHLGGRDFYPDKQGFDEFLVTRGRHFAPNFRTTPPMQVPRGTYLADLLTERAIRFLKSHRDGPFALYLAHYVVHIPLEAKQATIEKYRRKEPKPAGRPNNPVYAAMVEHTDESLGRILKALDELGLAENTVVIFFSDNGGLRQRYDGQGPIVTSNAPLRGEKGTLYEGGIRVPLIVRWPGKVEAGSVCDVPVSSVDFFPTMIQIAGLADRVHHAVDGVSLLPLLTQQGTLAERALYWHYPHYHHTAPCGAIRSGDWKLIEFYEDNRVELYNLKDDLAETHDLASQQPDRAKHLRAQLAAWRKRVGAKMPTPNPHYDPQRAHQTARRR